MPGPPAAPPDLHTTHHPSADHERAPAAPGARRPVRVALMRSLTPVYRAGLGAGLQAAGLETHVLGEPGQLPGMLDGRHALVVVLPAGQASQLGHVSGAAPGGTVGWMTVHVVEEPSPQHYADALRGGATGVVAGSAELTEVVDVIVAAAAGRTLLPSGFARAMSRTVSGPAPRLEAREREWLRRLADSGTVGGLARSSGYSEREMYRLLARVYARLGADNRTEALLMAERFGLLGQDDA